MITYDAIAPELQTGDILCWEGRGFVSRGIQLGQRLRGFQHWHISHVGIVVRPDAELWPFANRHAELPSPTTAHEPLLTYESTTLNTVADIITGQTVKGVSLVSLRDKLERHSGKLYVIRISGRPEHFAFRATGYMRAHHGRAYEQKPWQLLGSAMGLSRGLWGEDQSSLFCSELVTDLLEHAGALAEEAQDSDAMCPAEVCEIGGRFPLLGGMTVEPMREVVL